MNQLTSPQIKSNRSTANKLIVLIFITFLPFTLAAHGVICGQTTEVTRTPFPTLPALPDQVDLSHAINANEAGLIANSDEDQGEQLAAIMATVVADPDCDTVYVPEGRYYIAKAIALLPGVHLIGDGMGRTVFYRDNSEDYLVKPGAHGNFGQTLVANLSFRNSQRTLLMQDVHHMQFHNVEFAGGIVRFEEASHVTIQRCYFNRNLGKSGYASSNCSHMRLLHNRFLSVENGSINLSGHQDSYVAYNHITANKLIDSGYAGIRLPNTATNNLVENNYIENHGRGLFVLTYSSHNTLRHNTIKSTMHQGVLVQSPHNRMEHNLIIDAGLAAIRVSDAHYEEYPSSIANDNQIRYNHITDTKPADNDSQVGLFIGSSHNTATGNVVDSQFRRASN